MLALASSQDHKRLCDGDSRPEHGRHGRLLARAMIVTPQLHARVMREIILPDGARHGKASASREVVFFFMPA